MSIKYYFDEPLFINTQAQLYASDNNFIDTNIYDYIISFNTIFNTFFDMKTYMQNVENSNNVDINFTVSFNEFQNIYQNSKMQSTESNAFIYGSIDTIDFGTRILEILALKIFGNARARSAINNDTYIINNLQNNLYNHINDIINKHKYDMFNMYVQQDLPELSQDDITQPVNFNFTYDKIAFPGYIKGTLANKMSLSDALLNGPSHGINSIINGEYNIPILLMISDETINNNTQPDYNYIIILITYDDDGYVTYIAFNASSVYL
jgi:hypothetical protein